MYINIVYRFWIRKVKRNTKIPYKMEHTRRNIWQNNIDRGIRVIYNWFIQGREIFRKQAIRYLGEIY